MDHLLHRYGSLLGELIDLCEANPDLAKPLEHAAAYIGAEIVYAASHEGALHLDDVLMHRTRLNYEQADKGVGALDEIADLVAPVLGWDAATRATEIDAYRARAEAEEAAAAPAGRRDRRAGPPAGRRRGADARPGRGGRRHQARLARGPRARGPRAPDRTPRARCAGRT